MIKISKKPIPLYPKSQKEIIENRRNNRKRKIEETQQKVNEILSKNILDN